MNLWDFIEKYRLELYFTTSISSGGRVWYANLPQNPFVTYGFGNSPREAIENLNVKLSEVFKGVEEGIVCI